MPMPTETKPNEPNTVPVDIVGVHEPWAYAKLADGNVVKAKIVFMKVAIVNDEEGKQKFNEDGTPCYAIGTQLLLQSLTEEESKTFNQ